MKKQVFFLYTLFFFSFALSSGKEKQALLKNYSFTLHTRSKEKERAFKNAVKEMKSIYMYNIQPPDNEHRSTIVETDDPIIQYAFYQAAIHLYSFEKNNDEIYSELERAHYQALKEIQNADCIIL